MLAKVVKVAMWICHLNSFLVFQHFTPCTIFSVCKGSIPMLMSVWVCVPVHTQRQRRTLGVLLYHSALIPLKQAIS